MTGAAGGPGLLVERDGAVLTLILDRPDRMNAVSATLVDELVRAFTEADADDRVRAVVVTGRGRAFCAGADLTAGPAAFGQDDPEREANRAHVGTIGGVRRDGGGVVALTVAACRKPVIAAVNGAAAGLGATLTLPMDIRIASRTARFGFPFVRRGLVPEAASSWFLPRIVGMSRALHWTLTGRMFDADEALAAGLVSEVVEPEDLLPRAHELAGQIATGTSAVAVALTKQQLWAAQGESSPWAAHRAESRAVRALGPGADVAEGVSSFLQRRPPAFTGTVPRDLPALAGPHWPQRPAALD